MLVDHLGDSVGLALAEQGRGPRGAQAEGAAADDLDADRLGQPFRLVEARLGRAQVPAAAVVRQGKDGPLAARDPGIIVAIEDAQAELPWVAPSPAPSLSLPPRSSACAGWRVETACL